MIQTPAIVTFANKKGGVGKTTLCATFANYLYTMGVRVVVIDCDLQHSIYKCRDNDIDKYADVLQPYLVEAFSANDKDGMDELIEKLRNDPSIDVVLMDAPCNLTAGGLVPMFANSDIIVVPFHYDLVTVPSTASFIMFTEWLSKATHGNMKAKLFVLPNQYNPRVGKRSELQLWQNTTNAFAGAPKLVIANMSAMTSLSSIRLQRCRWLHTISRCNHVRVWVRGTTIVL